MECVYSMTQVQRPRTGSMVSWYYIVYACLWRKPIFWCGRDTTRYPEATISCLTRWVHLRSKLCKVVSFWPLKNESQFIFVMPFVTSQDVPIWSHSSVKLLIITVYITALMFLITWVLHPDPLCRATINDIERNAWVNQPVNPDSYRWEQVLPNTGEESGHVFILCLYVNTFIHGIIYVFV